MIFEIIFPGDDKGVQSSGVNSKGLSFATLKILQDDCLLMNRGLFKE